MRLLCLGDSLTFGFSLPRSDIWPVLAARETGLELVSWAVNGCTTGGMLALFPQAAEEAKPDLVFLMGGGNDLLLGGDLAGAKANLGCLAHLVCGMGLTPVIGVPPEPCPPVRRDWAAFADLNEVGRLGTEYADWLHGLCAAFGFPMIDFSACLPDAARRAGVLLRDLYLPDGLHPNRAGHRHMADTAAPILAALAAKADR